MRWRFFSYPVLAAILFGLYFSTAEFGLQVNPVNNFATLIWIPSGLALAFLFIFGLKYWPAVTLGAIAANYFNDAPLSAALGISVGNTLEPVVGAFLLKRVVKAEPHLSRVNHVLGLIFLAALFSPLISATGAVSSLWLSGVIDMSAYGSTWFAWWVGDAVSILIIAPLILTWSVRPSATINRRYVLELIALFLMLALIAQVVFVGFHSFADQPRGYLIFPPLIWAAMRFGQRASVTALFFLSAFATWQTSRGEGLFVGKDLNSNLLNLQIYTVILACTIMLLAAAVSERKLYERRKDEFISVASHELKTPITSIKTFVQTLQVLFERRGDKQSSAHMSRVNRQVDRLNRLVVKLLDLTRLQEGRFTLQKERFSIGSLIREAVDEISEVTHHKIQIIGNTRTVLVADKDRIGRVLTNLLTNAAKYSPDADKIQVSVRKSRDHLTVNVRDYGIGISKKDQEHVFDRFYQVARKKSDHREDSLGLGLYIAKSIIDRHGGKIWVKSNQKGGRGSTFCFTLPLITKRR